MAEKKLVYIASPYAGDIMENIKTAQEACRVCWMGTGGSPQYRYSLMYPQF